MRRRRFWNYPRPNAGPVQRWLPSWRIVVGSILGFGALGMGVFVSAYLSTTVPGNLDEVNNQATTVYYANGKPIGTFAEYKREKVELESLPSSSGTPSWRRRTRPSGPTGASTPRAWSGPCGTTSRVVPGRAPRR